MDNKDGACCFVQLFTLWRFKRKLCWFGHILFVVATILSGPSICALLFSGFKISAPLVTKILAYLLPIFFPSIFRWPLWPPYMYIISDISSFLSTMFSVWPHPFNDVTLLLLLLFQLQVFVLLCFVSIFSVWRCPWAVLRPDEAFWGGGFPAQHTLSIFGRLCGSRLFQYWGECYSVMVASYVK